MRAGRAALGVVYGNLRTSLLFAMDESIEDQEVLARYAFERARDRDAVSGWLRSAAS